MGNETDSFRDAGVSAGLASGLLNPRVVAEVFGGPAGGVATAEQPLQTHSILDRSTPTYVQPGYETGAPAVPGQYQSAERQIVQQVVDQVAGPAAAQVFDWRSHFDTTGGQGSQQYDPAYEAAARGCGVQTRYEVQRSGCGGYQDPRYQNQVAYQNGCNQRYQDSRQQQYWQQQQQHQQHQWEHQQQHQQPRWQQQQQQQQWQRQQQQQHWEQQQQHQQQQWQQQQWQHQQKLQRQQEQQWQQQQWQQQQHQHQQWNQPQQQWQQQQYQQQQWQQQLQEQAYWNQQQGHYDQQRYYDQVNYGQNYGGYNYQNRGCDSNSTGRNIAQIATVVGVNLLANQLRNGGGCNNGGWNQGYGGWNQGYGGGSRGLNQASAVINTIRAFSGGSRGYRGCR